MVSRCQGVPSLSASPPHMSTTNSPSTVTAAAAPSLQPVGEVGLERFAHRLEAGLAGSMDLHAPMMAAPPCVARSGPGAWCERGWRPARSPVSIAGAGAGDEPSSRSDHELSPSRDGRDPVGSLRGAAVVVTGASSGIGLAVAERFVAAGARVLTGSRREPPEGLGRWVCTDVADPVQAGALVAAAVDAFGRVDVVVNNAGVQVEKTVADTTDDEFDYVIGVNVRGVFNMCRAAVHQTRCQADGGVIVNVGSISGRVSDHGMAVYNASKAAVHGLTRSIAIDHGAEGIRCNAVLPGWIATPMADTAFDLATDPAAARAKPLWSVTRWVAWAVPRTWPLWCCGWPATSRRSCRAACSPSTAA